MATTVDLGRRLAVAFAGLLFALPLAFAQPAHAAAGSNTLLQGESLTSEGQVLRSSNAQYELKWSLFSVGGAANPFWALSVEFGPSRTFDRVMPRREGDVDLGVHTLVMQRDGNLVAYDKDGPLWASNTFTTERVRLVLRDDGRLVIQTEGGRVLWAEGFTASEMLAGPIYRGFYPGPPPQRGTRLPVGGFLSSPDGHYRLVMQSDGNLVLYGRRGPEFASRTSGGPDSVFVAQPDGNLVIYDGGRAVWASGTARPGNQLPGGGSNEEFAAVLQNDGNFVQYLLGRGARPLWSSRYGR